MFEVEKFARGLQGQWVGFGARRFPDEIQAREYLARFAESQRDVIGHGIRIDLRVRKGRIVIATAGGRDSNTIREMTA